MIITAERVKFKRPSSDKEELGLMVGEFGLRHIIIDNDLNIVTNYRLEKHMWDRVEFNLNEL